MLLLQALDSIQAVKAFQAGADPSGGIVITGNQIVSVLVIFASGYALMYRHMRKDSKENAAAAKENAATIVAIVKNNTAAFNQLSTVIEKNNRIQVDHGIIAKETVEQVRKNSEHLLQLKHQVDILGMQIQKGN